MRRSYRSWPLVLLVLISFSMLSCVFVPVTTPERIEPNWLDKTKSIAPGKTNRTSVRNLLGNPVISSVYWNLDIFRQSAKQHEVDLFYFFPAFYAYSTFYRYTLVTYDQDNIVNDIETRLVRASPFWILPGANSTDEYSYQWLELHAGNFTFIHDSRRSEGEALLVDSPQTAVYLRSLRPLKQCIAIVGSDNPYGNLAYVINLDSGEQKVAMPTRPTNSLAILMLSPGRHTIEVSEEGTLGKNSIAFNCEKGDVVYIGIDRVAYVRSGFWKAVVTGLKRGTSTFRIDLYSEIPDTFVDASQIIWSDGRWIVNPTHGRYSPDIFVH